MNAKHGFTLIELIVVLSIGGILLAISIPTIIRSVYSPERAINSGALGLYSILQSGKWYSSSNNVTAGVFYPSGNSYGLVRKMTTKEFSDNIGDPNDPALYALCRASYVRVVYPNPAAEIKTMPNETHITNLDDCGTIEAHVWDSETGDWVDYTPDMAENQGCCYAHIFTPAGEMVSDGVKARGEIRVALIEPDTDSHAAVVEVFFTTGRIKIK